MLLKYKRDNRRTKNVIFCDILIKMKKLILGATGSIGSALAKKIVNDGGQVHLVGRDETNLSALASELDSTFRPAMFWKKIFQIKLLVI